jgi:hypothetical protein
MRILGLQKINENYDKQNNMKNGKHIKKKLKKVGYVASEKKNNLIEVVSRQNRIHGPERKNGGKKARTIPWY